MALLLVSAALFFGCHEVDQIRHVSASAAIEPAELDFGEVPVGAWSEQLVSVHNVGTVPFTLFEALQLDANPSFQVDSPHVRLLPGGMLAVRVRFHPLAEGPLADRVAVATDAPDAPTEPVVLRGVGTPSPIRIIPERLDFQTLEVDSTRELEVTVENPVDLPVALHLQGLAETEYAADALVVPPLQSLEVKLRFWPKALGDRPAELLAKVCPTCTPTRASLAGSSVESAFAFSPAPVPFEPIPTHQRTESKTLATNITWRPVKISELLTSDPAFTPLVALGDREVGPGESVEVPIEFAARSSGPNTGLLEMAYASDRPRSARVMLDARGGRPQLALAPASIDFGEIPVGGKVEATLRLSNAGSMGDLHFQGVRGSGDVTAFGLFPPARGAQIHPWDPATAWPDLGAADVPIAPGGDALDLRVFFEPTAAGAFQATLHLRSDDPFTPESTVLVTGRARAVGPCAFSLSPQPMLDFGNVPLGWGAVLGFRFANAGTEECAVKDIRLSRDGGGAFFMPGGPLTGGVVIQDDAFSAMIAFRAPAEGTFQGELELTVSDPVNPRVTLPIRGVASRTCLAAAPNFLDFGPIRYDCSPEPRTTYVSNACTAPVTVTGASVGPGTSSQFTLTGAPTLPVTLPPGEGFELQATYARDVHGQHYSPLYVRTTTEPDPFLIPLLAETNHEGRQVERFIQGTDDELDVLFVVSNTTTMGAVHNRLEAAIPGFMQAAEAQGIDLRVGMTTTGLVPRSGICGGPAAGGEAGRLVPLDGSGDRLVSGTTGTAAASVQQNLNVGLCHNLVQGLETTRAALSDPLISSPDDPRTPLSADGNYGLLRPTARLAVVIVADEDDHSGFAPGSYVQFIQALKGPGMSHRSAVYAIVPTDGSCVTAGPPGPRFTEVARRTGGEIHSVCAGTYAPLLDRVAARAAGLQADFRLGRTPADPTLLVVRVDGAEAPEGSWSYDAASNSVIFAGGAVPAPGQTVEIRYQSSCQAAP